MDKIKQKRIEAGLTLRQAAEATGLTSTTIWRHENGHRKVSALAALAYHRLYGLPLEKLLRGRDAG